jgi:hypothetical protein
LNKDVVNKYFTGVTHELKEWIDEVAKETLAKHFFAFSKRHSVDRRPPVERTNGSARESSTIQPANYPFTPGCYQKK